MRPCGKESIQPIPPESVGLENRPYQRNTFSFLQREDLCK